MPSAPKGFFEFGEADFRLRPEEARWLCERLMSTEPAHQRNLLGCLAREVLRDPAYTLGDQLWTGDLPVDVTDEIRQVVHHAERFAIAANGAALLYNLMLAEHRDGEGDDALADGYRADLERWAANADDAGVPQWASNLTPFWDAILVPQVRIPPRLRLFVEAWGDFLASAPLAAIADDPGARTLVRERELAHKRTQARFANAKRLTTWNGASGTQPLGYRWPQVRTMFADIAGGLVAAEEPLDVVA